MNKIAADIQHFFINAVEKRCCTTERPIACLLSGGLDSSLVAALVNEYHIKNGLPKLETYSIGLAGSVDLKYAKIAADYLGTKHTEIIVSEDDFLQAIPEVIFSIESYDTTTVRASIGNWLLGKYIAANSEAKVIFNGDGADELAGGYLYTRFAKSAIDFDHECRRLLKDIYKFDVLRSDKCIASHGLEPRTPFLDRSWVQYYLSLPAQIRFHGNKEFGDNQEKYLIRYAFSMAYFKNHCGKELLPDEILWRKKEAFSDGVSKQKRSLYEIIQDRVGELLEKEIDVENEENSFALVVKDIIETGKLSSHSMKVFGNHLPPTTQEQFYYRYLFHSYFPEAENVVPYFWMPKFVEATDASARTLECYTEPYYDVTEQGLSI
jgi:asparagine synthase (glutamine-hydrolysing)